MPKPIITPPRFLDTIHSLMDPLDAKAELYRMGFTLIGTGTVAAAYRLGNSDRVVKLVCDRAGHRAAVDMFMAYPEVEEFPTIFGRVELSRDCFIYETEFLEPSSLYPDLSGEPHDLDPEAFEDYGFSPEAAEAVIVTAVDGDYYLDLHELNCMDRPCGDPVIIDPLHRFWSRDNDAALQLRSGASDYRDWQQNWGMDYWANVQDRAPYRGSTSTALIPLAA